MPSANRPLRVTDILLSSGALLIIVGVFVLASTGWESFTPASRIATAVVPLLALYAIGFLNRAKDSHKALSQITLLTGSAILPIVLGIIAYQSGIYPYVDSTLIFVISLISLIWFAFMEFSLRERWHAVGTIIAATVLAGSFGSTVGMESWGYSLMAVLLAYFFLSLSRYYSGDEDPLRLSATYGYCGAVLGIGGLMTFPLYLVDAYQLGEWSNVYLLVAYAVGGTILFGAAIAYSREWQDRKQPLDLSLRQVAETASSLFLTLPSLLIALGTDQTADILTVLVIGIACVILGSYVRLPAFRSLGVWTVGIGLLKLVFFAATRVGAGWPILLLAVGFILIGLAYASQQEGYLSRLGSLLRQPENDESLYGLGVNPEPRPSRLLSQHRTTGVREDGSTATFISRGTPANGNTLLLVIAILVFLVLIIRLYAISTASTYY